MFVVLALLTLHPLLTYGQDVDEPSAAGTTITRFQADYDVGEDGDVSVTETIQVDVGESSDRSGFRRVFDEYDAAAPRVRRAPRSIRVAHDGERQPHELGTSATGRVHTLGIPAQRRSLEPGVHTYVVRYELPDLLVAGGAGARLAWNVVPGTLAQAVDEAQVTVRLPEAGRDVRCSGPGGPQACALEGEGTSTLVLTASDLAPGTPVTLQVDLPTAQASTDSHLPWSTRWAQVLGDSWAVLLAMVAGIGFAGWYGHRLAHREGNGPGVLGAFGVVAAFVFFGVLAVVGVPGSIVALVPGAFAAFGISMLRPNATLRRR